MTDYQNYIRPASEARKQSEEAKNKLLEEARADALKILPDIDKRIQDLADEGSFRVIVRMPPSRRTADSFIEILEGLGYKTQVLDYDAGIQVCWEQ